MSDQENGDDDSDASSTDAIRDLTLEEARRRYDDEESRRYGVERKIGTIITVNALIISIVGIFSSLGIFALCMVAALCSVAIGLWTLRTRDYNRPGKSIDDFLQYSDMTEQCSGSSCSSTTSLRSMGMKAPRILRTERWVIGSGTTGSTLTSMSASC